jgi:hypothetical protein
MSRTRITPFLDLGGIGCSIQLIFIQSATPDPISEGGGRRTGENAVGKSGLYFS